MAGGAGELPGRRRWTREDSAMPARAASWRHDGAPSRNSTHATATRSSSVPQETRFMSNAGDVRPDQQSVDAGGTETTECPSTASVLELSCSRLTVNGFRARLLGFARLGDGVAGAWRGGRLATAAPADRASSSAGPSRIAGPGRTAAVRIASTGSSIGPMTSPGFTPRTMTARASGIRMAISRPLMSPGVWPSMAVRRHGRRRWPAWPWSACRRRCRGRCGRRAVAVARGRPASSAGRRSPGPPCAACRPRRG